MITVFDIPVRNYNNRTISTNMQRLGNHVGINSFWFLALRFEIFTIDPGTSITITYSIYDGTGTYLGGSTSAFDAIGKYELGISRSGLTDNANFLFDVVVDGQVNLGGTLYATERGEDIPSWIT